MITKSGKYRKVLNGNCYLGKNIIYKQYFESQTEAQIICNKLCKALKIKKRIKVILNNAFHPLYFGEAIKEYIILYEHGGSIGVLIHELTHIKTRSHLHDSNFIKIQKQIYKVYKEEVE